MCYVFKVKKPANKNTFSKSAIKTLEKGVKYVHSQQ